MHLGIRRSRRPSGSAVAWTLYAVVSFVAIVGLIYGVISFAKAYETEKDEKERLTKRVEFLVNLAEERGTEIQSLKESLQQTEFELNLHDPRIKPAANRDQRAISQYWLTLPAGVLPSKKGRWEGRITLSSGAHVRLVFGGDPCRAALPDSVIGQPHRLTIEQVEPRGQILRFTSTLLPGGSYANPATVRYVATD